MLLLLKTKNRGSIAEMFLSKNRNRKGRSALRVCGRPVTSGSSHGSSPPRPLGPADPTPHHTNHQPTPKSARHAAAMPSDQQPAPTVDADASPAPLSSSSPRWKKPSSGPHPRTGDRNRGPNPSPLAPPPSRSELKRRLRESAEAAKLALAAAAAARGPDASVAVDGAHQRPGLALAGGTVDVGQGTVQSDADDVALLAAAAAFRERHGRAPRRPDAAALFGSVRDSVSPHVDEAEAFDKLSRLESKFLHGGALGSSAGTHDRRVHDLSAHVWGLADAVPPPDGQDAEERCGDERRLITTERAPEPAPAPRVDAAAPMDLDAAPAPAPPASPPISKKRSPSPQPGMGDGDQDPNSSPRGSPSRRSDPNRRVRTSTEADARGSSVDGEHEDVQGLEPAGVADQRLSQDMARRRRGATADDRRHGDAPIYPSTWSDADEVTLLEAAAAFRERTGRVPQNRDAGVLLRSISGSISRHVDKAKVYGKLRRFKSKFWHEALGKSATAHDRRVRDLSAKIWDFDNTVARDATAVMPVVTEVLEEYWKMNKRALAGFPLEKGLSLLSKKEGRLIETRWRKQLDEEMQTQMQRHDLAKEICVLLNDTVKGLRA
ncbi:unnamed protein product [Urochloa decumbens]|uniref:Glabrous enhancer-binding protein-like DBD domain-containing protein n=1 Tax=Urochloa decumbens TaxID=240449 RepID=A0ABC8V7Y2_9POAL